MQLVAIILTGARRFATSVVKCTGLQQWIVFQRCSAICVSALLRVQWCHWTAPTVAFGGMWEGKSCITVFAVLTFKTYQIVHIFADVSIPLLIVSLSALCSLYSNLSLCTEEMSDCLLIPWPNPLVEDTFVDIHSRFFKDCPTEEHGDPPPVVMFALVMTPICLIPVMVSLVVLKTMNGDDSW